LVILDDFGVFLGILSKIDFREKGQLLDGHRLEAGDWRPEKRTVDGGQWAVGGGRNKG
jgi:hypothetical protein